MKKMIAFTIPILLYSLNSFSAAMSISCGLSYQKDAPAGFALERDRGESIIITENGISDSNHNFNLEVFVRQVCGADGGPCSDVYDLTAVLSNGNSKAVFSQRFDSADDRQDLTGTLYIGLESGSVLCEKNID